MTKLFMAFILLVTWASNAAKLKVLIKNIEVGKGNIVVAVYDGETTFFKKPLARQTAKADRPTLEFSFDLPEGNYAVAVYQDINDNKKLDRGWFGIPKEPYGLSNNFRPKFSAPTFNDCKFKVTHETTTTISLN